MTCKKIKRRSFLKGRSKFISKLKKKLRSKKLTFFSKIRKNSLFKKLNARRKVNYKRFYNKSIALRKWQGWSTPNL